MLLDQANLANPSVLDRLNPLLETDGQLMVNECGIQGPDGQVRAFDFLFTFSVDFCRSRHFSCLGAFRVVFFLVLSLCVADILRIVFVADMFVLAFVSFSLLERNLD